MLTINEQIVIGRSRSEVFEFFTNPENVTMWAPNVSEFNRVSGTARKAGAQMRGTVKIAWREMTFTVELVEIEHNRRTVERSLESLIPYRMELRFNDEGEGTRVVWHQEVLRLSGVFRMLRPVFIRLYSRDVRRGLVNARDSGAGSLGAARTALSRRCSTQ